MDHKSCYSFSSSTTLRPNDITVQDIEALFTSKRTIISNRQLHFIFTFLAYCYTFVLLLFTVFRYEIPSHGGDKFIDNAGKFAFGMLIVLAISFLELYIGLINNDSTWYCHIPMVIGLVANGIMHAVLCVSQARKIVH